MDGRIFYLKKQMLEKIQHQWTIKELAQEIDVSESYLQSLFKAQTGLSPIKYLRDVRLEKSRELIETKFYRLKQIGVEVGISSESHFSHDFKKKFGMSPTEYRKRFWEKIQVEESFDKK